MQKKPELRQDRITVAEAVRRVSDLITASTDPHRFPDEIDVYVSVEKDAQGNESHPADGKVITEVVDGRDIAKSGLRASFLAFCRTTGVKPRNLHFPWSDAPYAGGHEIQDYRHDISIDEFNQWAAAYQDSELPYAESSGDAATESDLLDKVHPAATPAVKQTADSAAGLRQDWHVKAREIADVLHLRDLKSGAYSSTENMGHRVAKELSDQGVHGPRGPVSGATVVREVLQGGRWKRPKA